MSPSDAQTWRPIDEIASELGLTPATVERWITEGKVDSRGTGRLRSVPVDALRALAAKATPSRPALPSRSPPGELIDQQMQRANHLAQVGTMALSIGHEINNPLTYVIGNNEYLKEEIFPELMKMVAGQPDAVELLEEAISLTQEMEDGASHIKNVVSDLSGMARRQNEHAAVDLRAIIHRSLQMAKPTWNSFLTIQTDLEEVGHVVANEVHLTQILMNVLTNAAYAVQGALAPRIMIRCFERGDWAMVDVADNGSGIAPHHLESIFDPFFTTKPVGEGTGLGLAVCRQLLKDMGGSMDITSALGHGTTVRVTIPLMRETLGVPLATDELARPSKGLRVLILDDDEAVLRSARHLLRTHGMAADMTTQAAHMLEAIQANRYDVYLCDLMMSDRTGKALYRDVTKHCPERLSKLVFMTGGAATEEARAFAHAQRARVVNKPFVFKELEARLLEAHQAEGQLTTGCPNVTRCPMFPRFTSGKMLSIYRSIYCEAVDGAHLQCARFQTMSKGTRPPATLMPNGDYIREPQPDSKD